jgi:hypothetical protein
MTALKPHAVTVHVDPSGESTYPERITFTCTAAPDASCRTYCPDCDQECDHAPQPGQECFASGWFGIGLEGTTYVGLDAVDWMPPPVAKTGLIEITAVNHDEGLLWEWAS